MKVVVLTLDGGRSVDAFVNREGGVWAVLELPPGKPATGSIVGTLVADASISPCLTSYLNSLVDDCQRAHECGAMVVEGTVEQETQVSFSVPDHPFHHTEERKTSEEHDFAQTATSENMGRVGDAIRAGLLLNVRRTATPHTWGIDDSDGFVSQHVNTNRNLMPEMATVVQQTVSRKVMNATLRHVGVNQAKQKTARKAPAPTPLGAAFRNLQPVGGAQISISYMHAQKRDLVEVRDILQQILDRSITLYPKENCNTLCSVICLLYGDSRYETLYMTKRLLKSQSDAPKLAVVIRNRIDSRLPMLDEFIEMVVRKQRR